MRAMKILGKAMLLVLGLGVTVLMAQGQSEQWKSYNFSNDGFSITAPVEPVMSKQSVPTEKGSFELRGYMVDMGSTVLYVGVVDYGTAVSGRDPNSVLQGAKNGEVSNMKAHITKESNVTLGVYPGVSFESEADSLHYSVRIYLVGTVLYQVMAASPVGKPYPGTDRFLDSFQLIPRIR